MLEAIRSGVSQIGQTFRAGISKIGGAATLLLIEV